jgi:V8-like Glu-specific endopeptidase
LSVRRVTSLVENWIDLIARDADLASEPTAGTAERRNSPRPGALHEIQRGDGGLLTIAGRAYGVPAGAERLRRAQEINGHPLNRALWRAPKNDFERQYFPGGIISLNPVFTCGPRQRRAAGGKKRCFPRIWIPPREDVHHPQLGRGIAWPASILRSAASTSAVAAPSHPGVHLPLAPELCDVLDAGCLVSVPPHEISVFGSDDRTEVLDTTAAPHRWVCYLHVVFRESPGAGLVWSFGGATGLLVSESHVLTAAHNLHGPIFGELKPAITAVAAVAMPGRDGVLRDLLNLSTFGAFLVKDRAAFTVPPEWREALRRPEEDRTRFDYGMISLAGSRQCATVNTLHGARPEGYWGADRTDTHVAARIRGFRMTALENDEIWMAGYPGDKPCTQWMGRGRIVRVNYTGTSRHNVLVHEADTARGSSGSPVWGRMRTRGRGGQPKPRLVLVGVHSGPGQAAVITPHVWSRIREWMNA